MDDVFFSRDRIFKLGPMRGIYFITFAVFFVLAEVAREVYRPYIYQNEINDFGFADVIGNLLGTVALTFDAEDCAQLARICRSAPASEDSGAYHLCASSSSPPTSSSSATSSRSRSSTNSSSMSATCSKRRFRITPRRHKT